MATMSATMKQFTKGLKTSLEPMQASLANIEKCSCLVSSRENEVELKRLEKEKLDTEKEQTAALKKIAGNSVKETKEKDKEKGKGFLAKHWGKILMGGILAASLLPSFKTLDTVGKTVREIEKIVKNIIQWVTTGSFGGVETIETAAKVTRLATPKPKPGKITFKQIKQTRLIRPTPQRKVIITPKVTKPQAVTIPETPERRVIRPVDRRLRVIKGGPLPKSAMPKIPERKNIVVKTQKLRKVPGLKISSLEQQRQKNRNRAWKAIKTMGKAWRAGTLASLATGNPFIGVFVGLSITAMDVYAETESGKAFIEATGIKREEFLRKLESEWDNAKSFTVNTDRAKNEAYYKNLVKGMSADQKRAADQHKRIKENHPMNPKKSSGRIPAPSPSTGKREYKRAPGGGWVRKSSFGGSSGFSITNASLGGSSNPFSNINWRAPLRHQKIDWATIHGQEGNRLQAYIPIKNGNIIEI